MLDIIATLLLISLFTFSLGLNVIVWYWAASILKS